MAVEEILSMLQTYGLTKIQAQIFIYLTRAGASSIRDLSKALKTNRMNIYRNLKRMENIGLINVLPGRPMKFSAVPANIALNTLLSAARSRILEMESKYATILESLSKISSQQQEYVVETKFRVHSGRRNIYAVMMQMLENCEHEAYLLTTPNDLACLSLYGFDETLRRAKAKGVKVNILTNISDEKTVRMLGDYVRYALIKHFDAQLKTRLLIVDDKSVFTSLTVDDSMSLDSESESGFWTDSPHYIHSVKTFFDVVWRNAQEISTVLQYLRTGRRIERIVTFSDIKEYSRYFSEVLNRAEGEALIHVRRLREPYVTRDFTRILEKASLRGVKIKLIAHLDEDPHVLREISSILNFAEVKHVDFKHAEINFVSTDTGESLLCCFPLGPTSGRTVQIQGLWSSFISFAQILRAVFMELWSKATKPEVRLMEIKFRRALKEMPKTLDPMAREKGLILEASAMIRGMSGLEHRFDLALKAKSSREKEKVIVGDALPENGDAKAALISLYLKAMDVKAQQKLFIIPGEDVLSEDEKELAIIYNIKLVDGVEPSELSQKILEKIKVD
ncbi:MAG: TrmB family transcriptional regulator sugar-binding domain-containing protein [Candidatus Bathyarchaeia archaeon]